MRIHQYDRGKLRSVAQLAGRALLPGEHSYQRLR